jgi:hypothetical protein
LALVFGLHYLGHENSALSLFVSTELDPSGHGLSHLKPEVDIGDLIWESRVSFYNMINGPDSGNFRVPGGGQFTSKVGHSNSDSVHSFPGVILIQ